MRYLIGHPRPPKARPAAPPAGAPAMPHPPLMACPMRRISARRRGPGAPQAPIRPPDRHHRGVDLAHRGFRHQPAQLRQGSRIDHRRFHLQLFGVASGDAVPSASAAPAARRAWRDIRPRRLSPRRGYRCRSWHRCWRRCALATAAPALCRSIPASACPSGSLRDGILPSPAAGCLVAVLRSVDV